ncbi:MAG: hypothetical protein AAF730_03020 [Bacteroidota bacterium]
MTYLQRVRQRLPEGLILAIAHLVIMETDFLTTWSFDHFLSLAPARVALGISVMTLVWAFGMAWLLPKLAQKSSSAA